MLDWLCMEKETKVPNGSKKRRRYYSFEEKKSIVEKYRGSGLRQRAFCQEAGVSIGSLKKWLRVKWPQSGENKGRDFCKGFIEVRAEKIMRSGGGGKYRLGQGQQGWWLEVESGFEIEEVKALYGVIRREEQKACK